MQGADVAAGGVRAESCAGAGFRGVFGVQTGPIRGKNPNSYMSGIEVSPVIEGKGTRVQEYGAGGC